MLAAAVAVFVLLPQIIGFHRVLTLLRRADPFYLGLALLAEAARYLFSASSTHLLTRLFKPVVRLEPLTEVFFAGAAANRTFSTAGAPGMVLRILFLVRQGISAGAVAVIFFIEDIAGLVVGLVILLIGILAIINAHPSAEFVIESGGLIVLGSAVGLLAFIYLYRRRTWVERGVHALSRGLSAVIARFTGRVLYEQSRVQHTIDEFYNGMSIARHAPWYTAAVLGLNLLRSVAGIAALYFCFLGMDWPVSPGILILLYTSASVLSAVSAVPGEIAIMGGSWAVLTLAMGLPKDIAMMALLLSRAIAFWLPIPIGVLAFWNLKRNEYL